MHFFKNSVTKRKFLCVFCQLFEQVSLIDEPKEDTRVLKTKLPDIPPCYVNADQVSLVEELKEDVKNLKTKEVTGLVNTTPNQPSNQLRAVESRTTF